MTNHRDFEYCTCTGIAHTGGKRCTAH